MVLVDRNNCTYKYSSNYLKQEILNFASSDINEPLRNVILTEHSNVLDKIELAKQEIFFYHSYSGKFPIISNSIDHLIDKKKKELILLKAELNAIKNILEIEY